MKNDNTMLTDSFNRPIHDLRISVIDRCNFRCPYCMPKEEDGFQYKFLRSDQWLRFEEIVRLVKLFVSLGVSKVRLTGGEPLLRPNIDQLIKKLSVIEGIGDLALTTNASLLEDQASALKKAGLHRLTVSIDSLNQETFSMMSGGKGDVGTILKAIDKAQAVGFRDIKINVVVQKGVNDQTILDIVKYFKGSGPILRFIEYMDVGNCNHWERPKVLPNQQLLKMIAKSYPLRPLDPQYYGEVASRYQFKDGSGEIGFVSSVTQPFCGSCTRARLSADGKIFTCLFATEGLDLMTPIREGASDDEIAGMIKQVWEKRADKYSENRFLFRSLENSAKKIEMFQIGG